MRLQRHLIGLAIIALVGESVATAAFGAVTTALGERQTRSAAGVLIRFGSRVARTS